MPRAAMSVATSTRTAPALKSFSARSRWFCERFECSVAVRILAALQLPRDAVRAVLRAREDEHRVDRRVPQQMRQQRPASDACGTS